MYDIKFFDDEKIELISDNTLVYTNDGEKICSGIITNKRFLILDYSSGVHNSMEDLRISGKITYIRKKEIIFSIFLSDIDKIIKDGEFDKIIFKNGEYVLINDSEIVLYLRNKI